LGLTAVLAPAREDERQAKKVGHELRELVTPRVMAIACGYPDANDAARLYPQPVFNTFNPAMETLQQHAGQTMHALS